MAAAPLLLSGDTMGHTYKSKHARKGEDGPKIGRWPVSQAPSHLCIGGPASHQRVGQRKLPQRGLHTGAVSFLDAIGRLWHPLPPFKDKGCQKKSINGAKFEFSTI